ncbi:class I mannose-6-phosphate isomerase [Bifidobacterium sp. SO1]|nr:class I mannose-6-phosphate isomerase [Bifidobacterium sp. SO1]
MSTMLPETVAAVVADAPPAPMLLSPAGKDYLWGGTRLKSEYNKRIDLDPLAETWECSVHPDGPSTVVSGEFKGHGLDEVLAEHPEFLGTKTRHMEGSLPILLKLIDAKRDLSVQVHPDDEFARRVEHQNGKTEMWYVLDAAPGAKLVCGFAHQVTPQILADAIRDGKLSRHLQWVPVHKGDSFYVPAGTVHALGAGVVVAEIQESSNVTYRVYDYDRVDKNGKKRELHFDKAMQVLNMKAGADVRQKPRRITYYPGCSRETICRCQYFEAERLDVTMSCAFTVMDTSFQVLLCLEGEGGLETDAVHRPIRFKKGDCFFIPAGSGRCHITGKTSLLKIRC